METTLQYLRFYCIDLRAALILLLVFQSTVTAQDCPPEWYPFMGSCYHFYGETQKTYQEARAQCESKGSGLLSVSTRAEHGFISRWLTANDPMLREWYTSGIREGSGSSKDATPKFSWRGTGDVIDPDSPQFWDPAQDFNLTSGVIVYRHGDGGYTWSIREPATKLPFICEVVASESYRVTESYRDFDYGLMKVDLARLERGPHFIIQPHSTVVVGKSRTAQLECVASGNPHPVYSWFKGDKLETRITSKTGRYTLTNGRLIIENPIESLDNGKYQCVVKNKFGIIRSDVVHLSFGHLGEFSNVPDAPVNAHAYEGAKIDCSRISFKPAPIADWGPKIQDEFIAVYPALPLAGHDVRLECFAYGTSTSEFRYSWVREGRGLPQNAVLGDHNRVLVLREATLDNQGVYTCHVRREADSDKKSFDLKLGAKPYFLTPIHNQHADMGSSLTWRCDARASPSPTFTWVKNGRPIVSDPKRFVRPKAFCTIVLQLSEFLNIGCEKVSLLEDHVGHKPVNNNVLVISKLDPDLHNGMYQCSVSNIHGTSLSEGQLRVLELAPNFYKFPTPPSTRAPLYGNATLPCNPEGAPASKITWFRNGVEINVADGGTYSMVPGGRLQLTSIQPSDAGRYTCRAENSLGVAESSTELSIVEGTYITVGPQNQKAPVNTTVFFECSASHAPGADMIFQWKFNGNNLDFYMHPEYEAVHAGPGGVSGLYIKHMNHHNTGMYECVAITTINSDTKGAYLEVLGPPSEPAGVFVESQSVSTTSLILKWSKGSKRGSDITHYIVQAANSFEKDKWDVVVGDIRASQATTETFRNILATNVTGLNPGCSYRFRVIAVNEFGLGPPSLPSRYTSTMTAPPVLAPTNLGGGNGKIGELHMTWKPLNKAEEAGPGIGYTLYWRRHTEEGDGLWEKRVINGSVGKYVTFVGKDNYYLEYDFKLQAFNARGHGPNSTQVIVMSAEDWYTSTMTAPPVLAPTNLGGGNGKIGELHMTWKRVINGSVGKYVTFVGKDNYYLEYDFKLQAFNARGHGPNSTQIIVMSAEDLPVGVPTNVEAEGYNGTAMEVWWNPVPDTREAARGKILGYQRHRHRIFTAYNDAAQKYPEEVRVHSVGKNEVEVWWRGVDIQQPESTLDGYVIYYWPAYENYRTATEHFSEGRRVYRARIKVEPGIVYALRVAAYSVGGQGRKSQTTYFAVAMGSQNEVPGIVSFTIKIKLAPTQPIGSKVAPPGFDLRKSWFGNRRSNAVTTKRHNAIAGGTL
ncbi:hypothetical protein EGW08_021095 [Elysia chlorotica]|uniref:Contactin n=1 Tax=Elysia chlorotica TaxID=188477 RepID=A0A433SPJ2_ELYCH|nr:hypothetical protein EGW08_021095 [Elysia chlorotica]